MRRPASSCINRKQQALVVLLVRQLADSQFARGDARGSERLWQEVAALEIDPERVIALLYSGVDVDDRAGLLAEDEAWLGRQEQPRRRGWSLRNVHLGAPRRPQLAVSPA